VRYGLGLGLGLGLVHNIRNDWTIVFDIRVFFKRFQHINSPTNKYDLIGSALYTATYHHSKLLLNTKVAILFVQQLVQLVLGDLGAIFSPQLRV
jgi:hypothetical protein